MRQLREKAGNPTYRALARKAGYSPATLSEAARGQRRPSLGVTMAYVGACGGDLDEWRLRWHDLAATETVVTAGTAADADTEAAHPIDVAAPDKSAQAEPAADAPALQPPHTRWRRWMRPPVIAAAVVVVAAVTGVALWAQRGKSDGPRGCPRSGSTAGGFTGQTYNFSRVRSAARLSAPVVRNVPAGCTLAFTGYCLGDVVTDRTSQTPDVRWFMLSGGGVMASGVVHGNPPPGLSPSSCPENTAPPTAIRLTVHQAGGGLKLHATGQGAKIVGFTSLDDTESGGSEWQQISSLTTSPTSTFETSWQPRPAAASPGQSITVAAVACLGGDGPTTVIDAQRIRLDGPLRTTSTSLSGKALEAATRAACQYP
ncbi:helix-turn-helix transcriptional regulator [Actinoallomurus vinaceus]|uniref:helix-turn-helix domain-containing protein n=1 Tax=Actinoallomurus vinaceus TaxID=1080074 RepID=UPI0031E8A747